MFVLLTGAALIVVVQCSSLCYWEG